MKQNFLLKSFFITLILPFIFFQSLTYSQKLIKEFSASVHKNKDANCSGTITFSNPDNFIEYDCKEFKCDIDVSCEGVSDFFMYSSGIKLNFSKHICLPFTESDISKNAIISMHTPFGKANYSGKDNYIPIITSKADLTGTIKCKIENDNPVLEIIPQEGESLFFIIKDNGLQYISGKGIVKVPKGKKYTYK